MPTRAIRYSNHAYRQMESRGIGRATVEAVVMAGELVRVDQNGVCRYMSHGIIVVVDKDCVVTAFRDSNQEPKYKPSKKPSGRDELKPHWLRGKKINVRLTKCYLRQAEGKR